MSKSNNPRKYIKADWGTIVQFYYAKKGISLCLQSTPILDEQYKQLWISLLKEYEQKYNFVFSGRLL